MTRLTDDEIVRRTLTNHGLTHRALSAVVSGRPAEEHHL
jgi:hypothetical protein